MRTDIGTVSKQPSSPRVLCCRFQIILFESWQFCLQTVICVGGSPKEGRKACLLRGLARPAAWLWRVSPTYSLSVGTVPCTRPFFSSSQFC